jgi:ABC-type branched-subunit amino acid transport system substrate-binding protein
MTITPNFAAPLRRRSLLAAAGLSITTSGWGQPGRSPAIGRAVTVAQIVDTSVSQQDVSKDFLIGSRAAWQDINAKGGLRGRPVQHTSFEIDGSPASLSAALSAVRDTPACIALSGTAGDRAATAAARLLRQENVAIAHCAPWLQDSSVDIDDRTFPIFAARQEQIVHALKSLSLIGVTEIASIYASEQEYQLYQSELQRVATQLKLKLYTFRAAGDLARLGQTLTAQTPAIVLFIGGTPELVQFTRSLEKQPRQRYVIALADVNLQTMMQMGAGRNTAVIATQAVPLVNASLPVVRAYRDTLGRLFDEPPTSLSLAGFIAARYTFEVLSEIEGAVTRQSALAAFQTRASRDIGGFRVAYDARRRSGSFVTQSMLSMDGRLVG